MSTGEAEGSTAPARAPQPQPQVGLVGVVLTVALFVVLAFGAGGPESSLLVFGPTATFALPAIAMIAFGGRTGRDRRCSRRCRASSTPSSWPSPASS
jgi:hypothetical protein